MGCWSILTFLFVILFPFVFVFALVSNDARQRVCYMSILTFVFVYLIIFVFVFINTFVFVFLLLYVFVFALVGNDARQCDFDMLASIPQWAAGQYSYFYLYF